MEKIIDQFFINSQLSLGRKELNDNVSLKNLLESGASKVYKNPNSNFTVFKKDSHLRNRKIENEFWNSLLKKEGTAYKTMYLHKIGHINLDKIPGIDYSAPMGGPAVEKVIDLFVTTSGRYEEGGLPPQRLQRNRATYKSLFDNHNFVWYLSRPFPQCITLGNKEFIIKNNTLFYKDVPLLTVGKHVAASEYLLHIEQLRDHEEDIFIRDGRFFCVFEYLDNIFEFADELGYFLGAYCRFKNSGYTNHIPLESISRDLKFEKAQENSLSAKKSFIYNELKEVLNLVGTSVIFNNNSSGKVEEKIRINPGLTLLLK